MPQITIYLPTEFKAKVSEHALEHNLSVSEFALIAILNLLKNKDQKISDYLESRKKILKYYLQEATS
jgi:hypothetical protein